MFKVLYIFIMCRCGVAYVLFMFWDFRIMFPFVKFEFSFPRYIRLSAHRRSILSLCPFHPLFHWFHAYWGGAWGCGWIPIAWLRCAVAYVFTCGCWGGFGRMGGAIVCAAVGTRPYRIWRNDKSSAGVRQAEGWGGGGTAVLGG